jgi:hypothetical protein
LLRFARSPDGAVVPDLSESLPGRGAWVRAQRKEIEAAVARNLFARAFRAEVISPRPGDAARFADSVAAGLEARALAALGLARRAGAVATGFEKARAMVGAHQAGVLVCASDAARDGFEKIQRAAGAAPVVRAFSTAQQSAALGLDKCVHAAIVKGPHADRFLREIERLCGFRDGLLEAA